MPYDGPLFFILKLPAGYTTHKAALEWNMYGEAFWPPDFPPVALDIETTPPK